MTLVTAAISIAISLAVFIIFMGVTEALRRRGIDWPGDIARVLSPDAPEPDEETV